MCEFELMDISDFWKVLLIDMLLYFKPSKALEDSSIWFVYFHQLKLL